MLSDFTSVRIEVQHDAAAAGAAGWMFADCCSDSDTPDKPRPADRGCSCRRSHSFGSPGGGSPVHPGAESDQHRSDPAGVAHFNPAARTSGQLPSDSEGNHQSLKPQWTPPDSPLV
ncbi:hypothetical protein F7725_011934 [Dissostichus mawsoni]|uniref:Uncharacterized protein n=1 Tax=Dissostichus mawsoni TaxID=36200 RepID=A0A7J5ZB02_DISMA|nr:hypothetical protein F7725_011934 [Dissostichus mawsoni]